MVAMKHFVRAITSHLHLLVISLALISVSIAGVSHPAIASSGSSEYSPSTGTALTDMTTSSASHKTVSPPVSTSPVNTTPSTTPNSQQGTAPQPPQDPVVICTNCPKSTTNCAQKCLVAPPPPTAPAPPYNCAPCGGPVGVTKYSTQQVMCPLYCADIAN